jgi:hypothetical protein
MNNLRYCKRNILTQEILRKTKRRLPKSWAGCMRWYCEYPEITLVKYAKARGLRLDFEELSHVADLYIIEQYLKKPAF